MTTKNGSMEQLIADGFSEDENLNCAETVFYAADRVYGFNLSPQVLKLSAAFGGGMGVEVTCGAISGGVLAVSHLFVQQKAHKDESFKEINKEIFRRVQEELGSVDCKTLKDMYRTEEEGCYVIKKRIGAIVEAVIDLELKKRFLID